MAKAGEGEGALGVQCAASRRQMLLGASLGALFAVADSAAGAAPMRAMPVRCAPVVSFHRDEPWVDPSGGASPFQSPRGLRGGASLANVSDEALRRLDCYL